MTKTGTVSIKKQFSKILNKRNQKLDFALSIPRKQIQTRNT